MNLYTIPAEYAAWERALEENGGELTPDLAAWLEGIAGTLDAKAAVVATLIRNAHADAAMFKEESAALARKARAADARAATLKALLFRAMRGMGVDRVGAGLWTASIRRASSPRFRWGGAGPIPPEYQRVTVELDGRKVHEAWKRGEDLAGFAGEYTEYLHLE